MSHSVLVTSKLKLTLWPGGNDVGSAIRRTPTLLIKALQKLHEGTEWSFTVLFGGPDPDTMGGALRSAR